MTLKVDCCFVAVVVALIVIIVIVVVVVAAAGFCTFVYTSCGELMFLFSRLVFIVPVHGSRNLQRLQFKVCASM